MNNHIVQISTGYERWTVSRSRVHWNRNNMQKYCVPLSWVSSITTTTTRNFSDKFLDPRRVDLAGRTQKSDDIGLHGCTHISSKHLTQLTAENGRRPRLILLSQHLNATNVTNGTRTTIFRRCASLECPNMPKRSKRRKHRFTTGF